ncbi:Myb family transcription factor EFM like [Actinidia chinensis var. chinensis]|uniref:Myb family transcription factor EFM like n=1 Tax=Actinidia chinensis var. chinensis TaxID=1590841 RepID=A0A2R6RBY4_ACTCC|nr:Myb family transcription factor EFM like [Actinidia chinensis var. chinensis]
MGSIPPELSLDIRPTFVPKTISCFLGEITTIGKISERMFRIDDFVKRLEDEMRKIDGFKRELPLSMMLLNDAIVILKEESMQCRTTNIEPVLEEFIPLKKNCDEEEKIEAIKVKDNKDKVDWMSSVQLWNTHDSKTMDSKKQNSLKGGEEKCKKRTGSRAFMSFDECLRKEDKGGLSVAGLSLGIKNPRGKVSSNGLVSKTRGIRPVSSSTPNNKPNLQAGPPQPQYQNARKQRRCWSPELHRRFVSALQQLGGPQDFTAFMSFDECLRKEDKGGLSVAGLSLGIKNPRGKVSSNGLVSKTRGIRPVSSSTPNNKPNLQAGPPQPQYQNARKQRRCWSPELHRRFVSALQQLGGPQVATPKQIRELIQVDGLTNDEIKSHLQKYRLHARKPPAAANKSTVNFRGLWLPPPQDDRFGESAKQSNSKSESPQGPLQLDGGGTCTTGEEEGDDGDDDDTDDEDEKSESYGWKIHIPKYGN